MADRKGDNPGNRLKRTRTSKAVRQLRVLTLKSAGHSDRDIATILEEQGINVSHVTVNKDWHEAIRERIHLTVEEAREILRLQMLRIESLLSVHFDEAMEGDIIKGNFILKLLKDQRELLGLRKPEVILYQEETEIVTYEEIEVTDDYEDRTDDQLRAIVQLSEYLRPRAIGDAEQSSEGSEGVGTS